MRYAFSTSNGVKWAIFFLIVIFTIGLARPSLAADLSFTKFASDIVVKNDASIVVTETIMAEFGTPHHGIFRKVPYSYTTLDGGQASIPITIISVTQDGQPATYQISNDNFDVIAKIGDPNVTIAGTHTYVLLYQAEAAVNFFDDHDELYWNATGDQWDAPLSNITSTVQFDNTVVDTNSAPPGIGDTACFTGVIGSTLTNCEHSAVGSVAHFSSQEFLTIVAAWPKGFVTKPSNYDELRQAGTSEPTVVMEQFSGWRLAVNIFLPLATVIGMWWFWRTHGRDPGQHRTIIAQYDPPDGLRPAEVCTIMHEHAPAKALSATLVDLAVRGYIKIIEEPGTKFLHMVNRTDYALRSLKELDSGLRPYERDLLSILFEDHLFPSPDNEIRVADLKKRKYTTDPFAPIFRSVASSVVAGGYFHSNPATIRGLTLVVGLLIAGAGGGALIYGFPLPGAIGLVFSGLIIALFSKAMPQRTAKGVEAAWVGHGFKLFLAKAEKYRIKWQERQGIFEQFLPYAMIFGVAEKWSKALAPIVTAPPSWYQGQPGSTFNTLVFWSAMSNFSGSISVSTVSAAASGSSGFGGGGFSGGGGGGGGGGGW